MSGTLDPETRAFLEALGFGPLADEALWREALTHGSTGEKRDYQRLEFLGDRVLGLSIAEWLYERDGDAEGRLSQRLNALVSGATCAGIARAIGLAPHIRLGSQARADGGADSDNILGDVMEAVLGANFVEHGFGATRNLVRKFWAETVGGGVGEAKHPKSALQEWAAGSGRRMPEYRLVDRAGPDHAARFTVAVSVKGVGEAEATAPSKGEAEKQAAQAFMERFG
ncbi:MAG: ribonuclease III [Candidatus Andeanibacterium colombiense]|uniref:Ribonuclease 3 n=1 Tax=Candidatus Andeanibacterium colombiense TaxID=3121345 RepID=A0AAJ5X728_9SPHN|nr:MAG: ribonuclease III [Sphingomonadaceae bacterium]